MIKFYTGGMFAGKTTSLLIQANKEKREGKRVGIFKPSFDTRYGNGVVKTHDGIYREAIAIKNSNELVRYIDDFDVFCFDEIQFFDLAVPEIIHTLHFFNKTVIVAGLNFDYKREWFANSRAISEIADEVILLHARCFYCGEDADQSLRLVNSDKLFELGSSEKYVPACTNCHIEHFEK